MNVWTEFEGFCVSSYRSIKTLLSMVVLETKLTKLSILPCLTIGGMLLVVVLTLWIASMGMLGCLVFELWHHMFTAFGSIVLLNIFLLSILKWRLNHHLHLMGFHKSRQYIKTMTSQEPDEQSQSLASTTRAS